MLMITCKKSGCLFRETKQNKIILLEFDVAILQMTVKFFRIARKMQLSQRSMQEIHCPLLLPCYFNYLIGNYSNDKSKIKPLLMKTNIF